MGSKKPIIPGSKEYLEALAKSQGEIKNDDSSWYKRNIVSPTTTWLNTRPGGPVISILKVASSFVPGVGEALDVAEGNPELALIGSVPVFGDAAQATGKVINELASAVSKNKIVKVLPEGKSLTSNIDVLKKKIKTASKKLKEQYDWSSARYGKLEDDGVGNRVRHFKNRGKEESIYPNTKDIDVPDYMLDTKSSHYGTFESIYPEPYFEKLPNGGYTSNTGRFILSDFLKTGGQIKPNFIQRLEDPNRKSIPDWMSFKRNPLFNNRGEFTNNYVDDLINSQYPPISTHKMSYEYTPDDSGRAIVYPDVQEINGKLVDFTRPPYHSWAAYDSALDRGDYLTMKDLEEARKWVETYKDRYKNLK